jgi:hypothetical protein
MAQIITNRIEVQSDYDGIQIKGFVELEAGEIKRVHGSFLVNNNQIGNFEKTKGALLSLFLSETHFDKLETIAGILPQFFQEIQEL